ncbi:MAG: hypothetical protein ACI9J2_002346 [Saprospiraceae bacterium]|jgi:hypothetical protein
MQWVLGKNPRLAQSRNGIDLENESVIQRESALSTQFNAALSHTRNSSSGNTVTSVILTKIPERQLITHKDFIKL